VNHNGTETGGNPEKTVSNPFVYATESAAFARQAALALAGIFAGVRRAGDGWSLTHDPDIRIPHENRRR